MFASTLCWKNLKTDIIFGFVFEESLVIFKKLRPRENAKPAFSNSSSLKSVFEMLRFRDGLVWTAGLTVEIKLCFQISSPQYERCL